MSNNIILRRESQNELSSNIDSFFNNFKLSRILQLSNFYKDKGIHVTVVFKLIFQLVFEKLNFYQLNRNKKIPFGKDVVYRFLNTNKYNWRRFLTLLSNMVVKDFIKLTSDNRKNVLIIDDSLYSRSRSKTVEMLSRVYDHVLNKYVKGFRLLMLGWSDGNSFVPLDFSLLTSHNEANRINDVIAEIDKRSTGYKRRKEGFLKKTDAAIELIKGISLKKLSVKYILFDSWFTYPNFIKRVLEFNLDVIAMVKNMPRVFYYLNETPMNIEAIYSKLKKKRGKAKIKTSAIVSISKDKNDKNILAKLVFVKNRNKKRDWLCLISTDINLSEEEIVRIYGKRWGIEVFFKICKSYLKLAKEFQTRSYNSMIASTTIIFTRYIMLSVENRSNIDFRTIGDLFYHCCDEIEDIKFKTALEYLLKTLITSLKDKLKLTEEVINDFIRYFISYLPGYLKKGCHLFYCES